MNLRDYIQSQADATDQQIAALYNADPSAWKRVESNAVLEWLGGNGRLAKLEGWITATADSADANVQGLRSAIRVLLLSASNPTTYLTLDPASQQRALLGFAVLAKALAQDDADALIAKARTRADVMEQDVAVERAAIAVQSAKDARLTALETYVSDFRAAVNAATSADALPQVPSL